MSREREGGSAAPGGLGIERFLLESKCTIMSPGEEDVAVHIKYDHITALVMTVRKNGMTTAQNKMMLLVLV